ncbi:putative nonaspanin (TM9SF) [Helianthus debilis subsp. tardiflorus]
MQESDIKWASRWDTYLLIDDDQIHWFPIVNSLMNVLIVLAVVAAGVSATLYRTISNYNQPGTLEEANEATGWQLVHTDVFRPPVNSELLCVSVGTGFQIFGMIVLTVLFGSLGFISTSNTGGLMTDVILLWAVLGFDGGFSMARLYKTFQGSEWIKTTLKTASMFPGLVFSILVVLNVVKWSDGSWGPVPLVDMFVLAVLWFAISLPLVSLGSYIGFKLPKIKDLVIPNEIPREIPEQSWYHKSSFFSIMMGGIIPFVVVFNALFPTLTFITSPKFYYIIGLVLVVLIMTSVEVTILLCYIQLCREDYLWWWRSYLTAGSSAFYLFIYATFYYFTKLNITELVPSVLYFGYMLIACLALFVFTGTIGFWACFMFTRLLYSSVKIV